MNCLFQKENDKLVCVNCGYSVDNKVYKNGIKRACKKPKPKIVSKFKIAKNTVKEQAKVIKEVVSNKIEQKPAESPESVDEYEKRLEICGKCEHYTGTTCKLCGCIVSFKARLAKSNCPIGKW